MADPRTIVLVEDDDGIRETMASLLTTRASMSSRRPTAKRVWRRLRAAKDPCLVLLDLWMPVMNGWQMLEAMRDDRRCSRVPVLVISAAGDLTPPAGASAFLRKPIRLETLLASVEQFRLRAS